MPEGGIGKFLEKDTAGIPNWGWLGIIVLGIGAAYVLPKFLGQSGNSSASTDQGANTAGLGLAIDPATGLPYAVEGMVPSGGLQGGTNVDLTSTNNLLQQLLAAQQGQNGSSGGTSASVTTTTSQGPTETYGLLGTNIQVNFQNRTYKNAQGQWVPLPLSQSAQLIQGSQGRVWYVENGIQYLLTAGQGPAVTNSGYPVGSQENTPGAYKQGKSATQPGLVTAQPYPATEVAAAKGTGGSTGAVSSAHFNIPGPGMGRASFVNSGNFSMTGPGGSVVENNGNLNVTGPGGSVTENNGNLNVTGPGGSVSMGNGRLNVTGPENISIGEGDISVDAGAYRPMLRWPFTESNFQQFASARGTSFQRLFELNPNLFNSDRIVSGQQIRTS